MIVVALEFDKLTKNRHNAAFASVHWMLYMRVVVNIDDNNKYITESIYPGIGIALYMKPATTTSGDKVVDLRLELPKLNEAAVKLMYKQQAEYERHENEEKIRIAKDGLREYDVGVLLKGDNVYAISGSPEWKDYYCYMANKNYIIARHQDRIQRNTWVYRYELINCNTGDIIDTYTVKQWHCIQRPPEKMIKLYKRLSKQVDIIVPESIISDICVVCMAKIAIRGRAAECSHMDYCYTCVKDNICPQCNNTRTISVVALK